MGEKVRKSHLKILQASCFATTSREGLTRETLVKLTAWHDSSASNHVLLTWLLHGLASRELLAKSTLDLQLSLTLYQLNTKPNTIKSHKIQGTKLKQLQHFLSWNKSNIKHSCQSQLYSLYYFNVLNVKIKLLMLGVL